MKNNFALVGIVFALFSVIALSAFASPSMALPFSCHFYGIAKVNYTLNPDYVPVNPALVVAYENGTENPLQMHHDGSPFENQSTGEYSIAILNAIGKIVKFKIDGSWADQAGHICDPDDSNLGIYDLNLTSTVPQAVSYYCDADDDGHASKTVGGTCNTYNCIPIGCSITPGDDCCDAGTESSIGCSVALRASIHPGVEELCGGIDYNCDGITNGCGNPNPPSGPSGGGGGSSAYCGDGILQTYRGEQCENGIACNGTGLVCNVTSCKCVACQEDWTCGEWGACSGGVQTRACADANACGTTLQKPSESQTCTGSSSSGSQITPLGEVVCGNGVCDEGETCETCAADCQCANAQQNQGFNLIGMFTGIPGLSLLGLLALAIIVLLLLATRRKKKKK
jgi:hypothetical protein